MLSDVRRGFKEAISILGTNATFKGNAVTLGFKTAGVKDEEVVNAYGVGSKIITIDIDTINVIPKKFDFIHIDSNKYVFEAVHPIYLSDKQIGWKAFVKGK